VREAEKAGNDLDAVVQRDVFGHDPFRGPIQEHDQQGDQEVKSAHYVGFGHD
jgi:hypothetical protein